MDEGALFRAARLAMALLIAGAVAGCQGKPAATDDAGLSSQVAGRISSDPNLGGQSIQASASGGVVTLSGTVTSDTARTIASEDVAQVAGVRTVVDNLVVQAPPASAAAVAPPPAPATSEKTRPEKLKKPSAMIAQAAPPPPPPVTPAPIERVVPPAPPQAPAPAATPAAPATPPMPPPPVVHVLTLPAGSTIPVRITQTLDSGTTQENDKFTGAIASDIIVDDMVVLAEGTPVTGHVDAVQDAAHFKGSSLLTISLTSINRKGQHIDIVTDQFTKEGEGRGKNTAEKVGGGAAVGAILGGIFGGGRGAAIGAAAGGGVGAGAQGATRGQQVQIPSETVVRFKLSDPIVIHVTTGGVAPENSGSLEHHTNP
jgi:BON domain-containing protein